jgi:hypothetical protein
MPPFSGTATTPFGSIVDDLDRLARLPREQCRVTGD